MACVFMGIGCVGCALMSVACMVSVSMGRVGDCLVGGVGRVVVWVVSLLGCVAV